MSHQPLNHTDLDASACVTDTTALIIPPPDAERSLNPRAMCFGTASTPEGAPTTTAAATGSVPHQDYLSDDSISGSDEDDDAASGKSRRCCCCSGGFKAFWAKWKYVFTIIALGLLQGVGSVVVSPILPGIKRRHFGGDKEAAFYQTIMQAIQASIGLVLCPLSGYAMDVFGRRPFFLAAACANLVPPVLLLIFYPNPLPYMISQTVAGLIIGSFTITYIADHYKSDKSRMMAFSFVIGGAAVSTVFSFLVFGLSDYVLMILSCVLYAGALLFTFFCIQESLPSQRQQEEKEEEDLLLATAATNGGPTLAAQSRFDWSQIENPFKAMKAVMNSKIAVATVVVLGLTTVSQEGLGEVYFYYLNERLGFDKQDNAMAYMEAGLMYPFVLFGVVPFLKKVLKLHSITIVMIALVGLAAEMTFMCVVSAKWQVFALALPMASTVLMATPGLITVIADGSSGADQGRRQAGLAALADFFGTLAPLFFGQIYSNVPTFWGFIPFAIAACLCVPALFLTIKLRRWVVVLGQRNMSANNSAAPTPRAASLHQPNADDDASCGSADVFSI